MDDFSGIRPLQTWNSASKKKGPRDNRAIFPTRYRSLDEPRFCLGPLIDFGCEAGKWARPEASKNKASKQQASITGHASDSLSESLIPTHFEPADGDFAEGGHRKRVLIPYYPVRGLSVSVCQVLSPLRAGVRSGRGSKQGTKQATTSKLCEACPSIQNFFSY